MHCILAFVICLASGVSANYPAASNKHGRLSTDMVTWTPVGCYLMGPCAGKPAQAGTIARLIPMDGFIPLLLGRPSPLSANPCDLASVANVTVPTPRPQTMVAFFSAFAVVECFIIGNSYGRDDSVGVAFFDYLEAHFYGHITLSTSSSTAMKSVNWITPYIVRDLVPYFAGGGGETNQADRQMLFAIIPALTNNSYAVYLEVSTEHHPIYTAYLKLKFILWICFIISVGILLFSAYILAKRRFKPASMMGVVFFEGIVVSISRFIRYFGPCGLEHPLFWGKLKDQGVQVNMSLNLSFYGSVMMCFLWMLVVIPAISTFKHGRLAFVTLGNIVGIVVVIVGFIPGATIASLKGPTSTYVTRNNDANYAEDRFSFSMLVILLSVLTLLQVVVIAKVLRASKKSSSQKMKAFGKKSLTFVSCQILLFIGMLVAHNIDSNAAGNLYGVPDEGSGYAALIMVKELLENLLSLCQVLGIVSLTDSSSSSSSSRGLGYA